MGGMIMMITLADKYPCVVQVRSTPCRVYILKSGGWQCVI